MGLEILRFSVPELVEGQNDKLNDTLFISIDINRDGERVRLRRYLLNN